jgi:hypothetical protein
LSTKLLPLVPHYLLDINCGVVIRVTAEQETWVVEATCGHLEVAKKTNSQCIKRDYWGRREMVGGGKV